MAALANRRGAGTPQRFGRTALPSQRPIEPGSACGIALRYSYDGAEIVRRHVRIRRPRHDLQQRAELRVRMIEVEAVTHDLLELLERQPRGSGPTELQASGCAR